MSTAASRATLNALTVDVEDWYHDESRAAGEATPEEVARAVPRVQRNLETLLEILAEHGARATLFVLADVARNAPSLVRGNKSRHARQFMVPVALAVTATPRRVIGRQRVAARPGSGDGLVARRPEVLRPFKKSISYYPFSFLGA